MSAYVIVEVTVNDPDRYEDYKLLATPAIVQYGGRYLARGGETVQLEGTADHQRIVVLEFDDIEQAQRWHDSPEYREAKAIRHESADSRMVVVAGL